MIEPYYRDELVTLYCGDARELADELGAGADVLIVDPPYGVDLKARQIRNYRGPGSHAQNPSSVTYRDDPDYVIELVDDVIEPAIDKIGRALVFSGFSLMWDYPRPDAIGWVTCASAGYTKWGFGTGQPILFYGPDPYLADGRGGRPNGFTHPGGLMTRFDHPAPKPLSWMRWAVDRASRPDELVFDPLAGVGTTLLAARQLGRRAVGIELVEHYCAQAARRFEQLLLPFDEQPAPLTFELEGI